MICRLCGKSEPYSIRFCDFGSTLFWCRSCHAKFQITSRRIVVPLETHTLQIESIFSGFTEDNVIAEGLWMKAEKLLKTALSQDSNTTVIFWFDALIEYLAPIWLKLFEGMGDLLVISLFELDPLAWIKNDS